MSAKIKRIYENIKQALLAAADFILPRACLVCGRRLLLDERILCLHCLSDMPFTRFWELKYNPMADRFNALIQQRVEKVLQATHERYAFAAALFFYSHDAEYRQILYHLKYEGRTDAGRRFGKMLGARLRESDMFKDVDCVMPVPLHWSRRWRRGYNQAEIIAQEVAESLGVKLSADVLSRCRRTRTQTQLDVKEKAVNVSDAFIVRGKDGCPIDVGRTRHILLVDDTFTTGSTLYACFSALRSVFPPEVRISVATLAFVGGT